jgi:alpha-1,2-mannosyltransferase
LRNMCGGSPFFLRFASKEGEMRILIRVRKGLRPVLVAAALVAFVVALGLNARFGMGILTRISADSMNVHPDFDTFWRSAEALWEGKNIYDTGGGLPNLNPPLWTILIAPLGLLEPLFAYRVFILITLVMVVGYLAWVADELRLRGRWAVVGTAMLLLSSPLLLTLALGQLYAVLALGLAVAWISDRRDEPLISGSALGLVVALKPSLAPVLLWPLARRRWRGFVAALVSGAAATVVAALLVGPAATLSWLRRLFDLSLLTHPDNASLLTTVARLFTKTAVAEPIATLPWMVPVAYALSICVILLTAIKLVDDPEAGLWALVAATLLASPIAWHMYLVLLGPGVLLLLARGWVAPSFLLLSLQLIPPHWPQLWSGKETVVASLALALYFFILVAHWLIFLSFEKQPDRTRTSDVSGAEPG